MKYSIAIIFILFFCKKSDASLNQRDVYNNYAHYV